jgi:hypothetical protein
MKRDHRAKGMNPIKTPEELLRSSSSGGSIDEDTANVDQLANEDVPTLEAPSDVREKQFNSLRPILFYFGIVVSGACVLASIILAAAMYLCPSNMSDTVAVAFISGLTVETLGIIAIIAHSLFPSGSNMK